MFRFPFPIVGLPRPHRLDPPLRASRRAEVPPRALLLSLAALAIPLYATVFAAPGAADYETLLWLLALVPAFLLAYHRGWPGAALALSCGMGALTAAQLVVTLSGRATPDWTMLLLVVAALIGISLGIGWVSELLHRERDRAALLAMTDELTGLANRRHARMVLEHEVAAAGRGRPLAVVLFDVDHFKRYNDRFGHHAGDEALRGFARVLRANTRRMDLSARYGGEEFLSILSDTDLAGARHFCERVRADLGAAGGPNGQITVSAGIAEFTPSLAAPDALLALADDALYRAKLGGRDRAETAASAAGPAGLG